MLEISSMVISNKCYYKPHIGTHAKQLRKLKAALLQTMKTEQVLHADGLLWNLAFFQDMSAWLYIFLCYCDKSWEWMDGCFTAVFDSNFQRLKLLQRQVLESTFRRCFRLASNFSYSDIDFKDDKGWRKISHNGELTLVSYHIVLV